MIGCNIILKNILNSPYFIILLRVLLYKILSYNIYINQSFRSVGSNIAKDELGLNFLFSNTNSSLNMIELGSHGSYSNLLVKLDTFKDLI